MVVKRFLARLAPRMPLAAHEPDHLVRPPTPEKPDSTVGGASAGMGCRLALGKRRLHWSAATLAGTCSQILSTVHPVVSRAAITLRSRSTLGSSLVDQ